MNNDDDFIQTSGNDALIEESIQWLEQYGPELTDDQCRRLHRVAEQHITIRSDVSFSDPDEEPVDVAAEIKSMVRALRSLRNTIVTDDGQIRQEKDARDLKEVVASTTQLLTLLMKSQEKLDHMERLRAIEEATTTVVRTFDEESQKFFFEQLEKSLGNNVPTS